MKRFKKKQTEELEVVLPKLVLNRLAPNSAKTGEELG